MDLCRMAFELSNGQLRQGLRHLDEDLLAALDEPRPNWDVELRVRDNKNGYGLFSGIWGEPPSRAWSIRLELHRFTITPSRDPCRCRSLAAILCAALNRLQEAYLETPTEPPPRFVWQHLACFGCGILDTPTTVREFLDDTFGGGRTISFRNASAVWAGGSLLQHYIFALEGPLRRTC